MVKKLQDKIKKAHLTKKEKLIAEFFLDNPAKACFMTATNIAAEVNVSDTSVIRFSYALGFSNFNELKVFLQKELRDQLQNNIEYNLLTPKERLEQNFPLLKQKSLTQTLMEHAVSSLKDVFIKNSADRFSAAADIITKSRKKYIFGFRTTIPAVSHMSFVLSFAISGVEQCIHADARAVESLIDMTAKDCIVIFAFSRYGKIYSTIYKIAREKGAKIIVITDSLTAPVASGADIVILINAKSVSFFNTPLAAIFASDIICSMISRRMRTASEKRLDFVNTYISPTELY
jgi:DNA-binding MurR/RpiR family transcriptional regulator